MASPRGGGYRAPPHGGIWASPYGSRILLAGRAPTGKTRILDDRDNISAKGRKKQINF